MTAHSEAPQPRQRRSEQPRQHRREQPRQHCREQPRHHQRRHTPRGRPASLSAKIAVVVADWWHVAGAMVRAVLDRTPEDAFTSGERTPVIIIPGIVEPWRFMLPLVRHLHACGHPVYPLPALGWNGRSLDDSLHRVRRDLDRYRLDDAVLVAHSKGGLIGKLLLADPSAGRHLSGLVALCSPFTGSSLAWRFLGPSPLGMFVSDGADIARLAEDNAVNHRIVSLGSAWDEMIPNGTHLPGARNLTLTTPGHFLPVSDPQAAQVVCREVGRLGAGGSRPRLESTAPTWKS